MKRIALFAATVSCLCVSALAWAGNPILETTPSGQKYLAKCSDTQKSHYRAKTCQRLFTEARIQFSLKASAETARTSGSFAQQHDLPQMNRVDEMRRAKNHARP